MEIQTEEPEKRYMVICFLHQNVYKGGFFNRLSGKTIRRVKPIIQTYTSREAAEQCFDGIRSNENCKPVLLKILRGD